RHVKAAQTTPGQPNFGVFTVGWQSVVEHAVTADGRALAARLGVLNDFRQINRMELDLVERAPAAGPLPEQITITPNDQTGLVLFTSAQGPQETVKPEGSSGAGYRDDQALESRMGSWGWPQAEVDQDPSTLLRVFALGVLLLAAAGYAW